MSRVAAQVPEWVVLPPEVTEEDLYVALGPRPDPLAWHVPVSLAAEEQARACGGRAESGAEYAIRRTVERRLAEGRLL